MRKSSALVVMALVVSALLVLVNCEPTEVGCGDSYDPASEPDFAANVNTIIESMHVSTASAPNRVLELHLPRPDVYGHSTCLTDEPVSQCTACLTLAMNDMTNTCGSTKAGSAARVHCSMQYW